jgi:hypothetical protein
MSKFTSQYVQLLKTESRISKSGIKPRNIYRLSVYRDGDPKSVKRFVFVIGIIDKKIHCIKLNDIRPLDFTNLLFKLRDKRIPVDNNKRLSEHLIRLPLDGKRLFESYIKKDKKLYSKQLNNYRTYILDKVSYVSEVRFENEVMNSIFKISNTETDRRLIIDEEIDEKDG